MYRHYPHLFLFRLNYIQLAVSNDSDVSHSAYSLPSVFNQYDIKELSSYGDFEVYLVEFYCFLCQCVLLLIKKTHIYQFIWNIYIYIYLNCLIFNFWKKKRLVNKSIWTTYFSIKIMLKKIISDNQHQIIIKGKWVLK